MIVPYSSLLLVLLFCVPVLGALMGAAQAGTAGFRRLLGIVSTLSLMIFFGSLIDPVQGPDAIVLVPGLAELNHLSLYCGVLFNFVYLLVFTAFGERVFATRSIGYWHSIQLLVSLALVCDSTVLFALLLSIALVLHLQVSQMDVYQVSRRQDRFILVTFFNGLAILLTVLFFGALSIFFSVDQFSVLVDISQKLPRTMKVLSSVLMMVLLGAFPFHFWVKPLFAAPARYGLAVIARLNIGFVAWCKLYPVIFAGDPLLDQILTYGCAANLLYAAFLLFGERKLSQIVSALYLFHVPLLILAVKVGGAHSSADFTLDFANITVAISGLLMILGMLRDRLGAETLDQASGLGISYPFLGIAFLICLLSLVGFPGTLGFICSEVILHHFAESTWPVAVAFIITLALNGYSSFRIFGESFYGDPAQSYRRVFQPIAREKCAVVMVLLFLFFSGVGPQFLHSTTPGAMKSSASADSNSLR